MKAAKQCCSAWVRLCVSYPENFREHCRKESRGQRYFVQAAWYCKEFPIKNCRSRLRWLPAKALLQNGRFWYCTIMRTWRAPRQISFGPPGPASNQRPMSTQQLVVWCDIILRTADLSLSTPAPNLVFPKN